MSEVDFSQYVTYGDFAKKIGIKSAQTIQTWAEKEGVKPVHTYGNMNLYKVSDLEKAMENRSSNAEHFRKLGYVHPDQHKAVMDHRDSLAVASAALVADFNELTAEVEALRKRDAHLSALEAAGVDNWDGYVPAVDTANNPE